MKSTSPMGRSLKVWRVRQATCATAKWPSSSTGALACATVYLSSSSADRKTISSLTQGVPFSSLYTRRNGCLDEAELVDARERRQRADQADVRTFRRLDRADASVVALVHVADVESGALAGQATGPQRRQTPLVRELGERVGLVHELRQLAGPEELLDRRDHRARIDQARGGDRPRVADGHALLDDSLHADQAHAELVLQKLADRAHAAVAEVVDVVGLTVAVVQVDELADDRDEVLVVEDAAILVPRALARLFFTDAEVLVELEPADLREVEAARVEEQRVEQVARVLYGWRIARADLPVQLDERFLDAGGVVLLERRVDVLVLGIEVDIGEERANVVVARVADRAHQRGDRHLALTVNLDCEDVLAGGLDLEPGTAVGDELGREEEATGRPVLAAGEVHARRAHELRDDHALGAVHNERPGAGHHREVAHEDLGFLDLAGVLAGLDVEPGVDPERRGEGHVTLTAFLFVVFGLAEFVVEKAQFVVLSGVVRDRVDLVEQLPQPFSLEPLERVKLGLDQVSDLELVCNLAVRLAGGSSGKRKDHMLEFPREGMRAGMRGDGHNPVS